jgi:hypothetical protein
MTTIPEADPLVASLVEQLQSMRRAERDIFGALDAVVRDRPMRPGDWSPKDHQAHLTAWKGRQVNRIRATRLGDPYPTDDRETDEINAELRTTRVDWAWPEIVREADVATPHLSTSTRSSSSGHPCPMPIEGSASTTSPVPTRWRAAWTALGRCSASRSACGRTSPSSRSKTPTSLPCAPSCPRSSADGTPLLLADVGPSQYPDRGRPCGQHPGDAQRNRQRRRHSGPH